jgi:hypothetical protein
MAAPGARKKRGCLYWLKLLLVGTIGGLILAYIAYFPIWADIMARPNPSEPCCTTPADQGFLYVGARQPISNHPITQSSNATPAAACSTYTSASRPVRSA